MRWPCPAAEGIEKIYHALATAREHGLQPGSRQLDQRAGEKDDQALDHHDHLARHAGDIESELGAALLQRAEQQGGECDARRMVAPHQRYGVAGTALAAVEIEPDAIMNVPKLLP